MVARDSTQRNRHRAAIRRTKPPCALCGEPIDYHLPSPHPDSFTIDHIVPLTRGGTDEPSNIQTAHRRCNLAKSDRDDAAVIRRSGTLT